MVLSMGQGIQTSTLGEDGTLSSLGPTADLGNYQKGQRGCSGKKLLTSIAFTPSQSVQSVEITTVVGPTEEQVLSHQEERH
jgi:hypothetical protein